MEPVFEIFGELTRRATDSHRADAWRALLMSCCMMCLCLPNMAMGSSNSTATMNGNVSHLFTDTTPHSMMWKNETTFMNGETNVTTDGINNSPWKLTSRSYNALHARYVTLIVALLIGFLFVLIVIIFILLLPYVRYYCRRMFPVSKKKLTGRRRTIDCWLITKVSTN
jgi:hypothetical protein